MTPIDLETARHIIDFSGGQPALGDLGNLQLEGAVALHNMLVNPDIGMGYLADEVGMGKTYIALGVVAFLRYFNPKLKVLYICPSRNVQEKWLREYLSMTKYNIQTSHYRIRSVTGKPASPYVSCRNVPELIRTASLGHFSDIFISKSSFSISLSDDESSWVGKLKSISTLVPAHQWDGIIHSKAKVKDQYAAALNYILPTFDLVIIDEAHNFKKDANSSDRNRVLSQMLGFSDREKFQPRARNALLLSATPYDRDISQLRNQLILIGKQHLLPDNIDNNDRDSIKTHLQAFMVRRLNALKVNDTLHTRNMYRTEHRQGEQAEITLNSDEQKLVTALVQKKVGDTLTKSGSSPAFQIGMMASFESYAQTAKTEPVQFDGDETEKQQNDAMDRHVVAHIVDSFKQAGLGKTLPHPKMDSVTEQLAQKLFHQGQKQIVFVRRVKSVKELKDKLDDHYNHWLKNHIFSQLAPDSPFREIFTRLFNTYHKVSLTKDSDISEGQFVESTEGDTEDHQPAKNDTFFSWFFRGELDQAAQDIMRSGQQLLPTPDGLRKGLTAKNQVISLLLELNWAQYVTEHYKDSLELLVNQHHDSILALTKPHLASQLKDDLLDVYRACQIGFLQWYAEHKQQAGLLKIANALKQHLPPQHLLKAVNTEIKPGQLLDNLRLETFYTALHRYQLACDLFPLQSRVFEQLRENLWDEELYDRLDIHVHLISLCLRTGHGVIDLYLARIRQGAGTLTENSRRCWMNDLVTMLKTQQLQSDYSTFSELSALAANGQLELIIKTNIPEVFDEPLERRRTFLSHRLNPVSPVIGATGETAGNRSAQARKFRMPGYPLALISTDVFQEGEDLHTFCDSIYHYGLSGTPIGIEQKTGRVDRVNSLVQRRFINHHNQQKITDSSDFIQVTFPHIRESIERLQVRQLCHNLNDFIKSLHEFGDSSTARNDLIDTQQALLDKSEIPQQITTPLESPYIPNTPEPGAGNRLAQLETLEQKTTSTLQHIKGLLKTFCGSSVLTQGYRLPGSDRILSVKLESAKNGGEILLIAEEPFSHYKISDHCIEQCMKIYSERTFYRIIAEEEGHHTFRLKRNAEILVGNESITEPEEIEAFFNRFHQPAVELTYQQPSEKIHTLCQQAQTLANGLDDINGIVDFDTQHFDTKHFDTKHFDTKQQEAALQLTFRLGINNTTRTQKVIIRQSANLCIFTSKAAPSNVIRAFRENRDRKIIEYTWERNRHTDVVEFFLDSEGDISGRITHPEENMSPEEFIFCAYTIAVEADRLEYIVSTDDVL